VIVAFDLDDTLYPEVTYVDSGFRAIARRLAEELGVPERKSLEVLRRSLEEHGRGRQIDDVLAHWGAPGRTRVRRLLAVYRSHRPELALPAASRRVLERLRADGHALYLVTDGNARVQAAKVEALGLGPYFRYCYLTHRYGLAAAKPATRVFELMLRREQARPEDLVYVGDDPSKDFVGVRALGGATIRVLAGRCTRAQARPGYDAAVSVERLDEILELVADL
jgi:putative hydrolase of the HAD superfamily